MYQTTVTFKTQFFPWRIWFFTCIFRITLRTRSNFRNGCSAIQWKLRWRWRRRQRLTIDDAIVTDKNNTNNVGVFYTPCSYDTTVARRYCVYRRRRALVCYAMAATPVLLLCNYNRRLLRSSLEWNILYYYLSIRNYIRKRELWWQFRTIRRTVVCGVI